MRQRAMQFLFSMFLFSVFLTLLVVFNSGCAPKEAVSTRYCKTTGNCTLPPPVPNPYNPDLKPYIEEFTIEAKNRGVKLNAVESIEFQDGQLENSDNVLGVCYTYGSRRWIKISSAWWETMTDVYKRQLIYHEYGHCGLSRPHYDESFTVDGKNYYSIMTTYVTFGYDAELTEEWPVLADELFVAWKYHAETNLHDETLVEDHCFVTPEGYTACPISVK